MEETVLCELPFFSRTAMPLKKKNGELSMAQEREESNTICHLLFLCVNIPYAAGGDHRYFVGWGLTRVRRG